MRFPRPPSNEDTLMTNKIQIKRKTRIFTLKENPRGPLPSITEDANGHRDNLHISSNGLGEFCMFIAEMAKALSRTPNVNQI
jgi:hypothetical protein